MFQVGDIVQVIIVPKKYKQYDIAGATGVVKTVYSNNIRIHISSYYNEELVITMKNQKKEIFILKKMS